MATTQNNYTGNGSNKLFSITFPYLDTADIDVSLNGTLQTVTTQYFFANATTVEFVTAPANGAAVRLDRSTNDSALAATFFPGSSIKAADLNADFDQTLYVVQEINNKAVKIDDPLYVNKTYVDNLALAGTVPDGDRGDITVSGTGTVWSIDAGAIVNADVNASAGITAGKLSFTQAGTGAVQRTVDSKLKDTVSVKDFGAVGNGVADDTAAIQAAINASPRVFLPDGVYVVSAVTGLIVKTGTSLIGSGKNKTILLASSGGGTSAQLISYTQGSVIKRSFNPSGTNLYVNECYFADFSVVLTHPLSSVTTTGIQIGLDLRNITRSVVERVHVGNIPPVGGPVAARSFGSAYEVQGYGIVLGNVSSGSASYAGGEVNTIRDCSVWGAYKTIVQDDGTLSPNSAALATSVVNCDIQAMHHGLVQESQYGAGCFWRDNVIQNIKKQPGDTSNSFAIRCEGYNNEMSGTYLEAGANTTYLLYLGTLSKNNIFKLSCYSATVAANITDSGARNQVFYFKNTGSIAGGTDSAGVPVQRFNGVFDRELQRSWVKFYWNGSAVVIDGSDGVSSVARTGPGDYTITWEKVFPSTSYAISVLLDTNASGHGGLVSVGSHSTSNMRIYTYGQNGATTTQLDPRYVWIRADL